MTARLLGYWKSTLTDPYPLPQHFEAQLDAAIRDTLVAYLDAGQLVNQYRGHSYCRYGCGANGSAERTDGEWLWPEGLAHYVACHSVTLPREFMEHVARSQQPGQRTSGALTHVDGDETDWLAWSDERTPTSFKTVVANARAKAERCAEAAIADAARKAEVQYGVSDVGCRSAGCDRYARRDRALCAACLISGDGTAASIRIRCDSGQLALVFQAFTGTAKAEMRYTFSRPVRKTREAFLRSVVPTIALRIRRLFSVRR